MKRTSIVSLAALLLAMALAAEEYLPTPYTAEQIRDAWVEGFEVVMRTRSAAGEMYSRMRVVASTETEFQMVEIEVDREGRPAEGAQESPSSGTWEQLRDHAKFPTSRATRERARWDTPLGRLEGWLYRVEGDQGTTEFFFADGLPGPPVVYRQQGENGDGFLAEQVSRQVAGSD